jgi:hypothetical protein
MEFGAVGDGVTDDSQAIQDWLDAAAGGLAFAPAGTYLNQGANQVESNTTIFGDGWSTVFILDDAVADDMDNYERIGLFQPKDFATETITGVTIRDLKMDGNAYGQFGGVAPPGGNASPLIHGVYGVGVQYWTLIDLWAQRLDGDGYYFGRGAVADSPARPKRCKMIRCVATENLRNGGMWSDMDFGLVEDSEFFDNQKGMDPANPKYLGTDSVASPYPSAEFDFEPNAVGQRIWKSRVVNTIFRDGNWVGAQIGGNGGEVVDLTFENCDFVSNAYRNCHAMKDSNRRVRWRGCRFYSSGPADVTSCHLRISRGHRMSAIDCDFVGKTGVVDGVFAVLVDDAGGQNPDALRFLDNLIDLNPNGEAVTDGTRVRINAEAENVQVRGNYEESGTIENNGTGQIGDTLKAPASTATYTIRALANNTEYTPSTTRPTFVTINPRIDCDENEEGHIDIRVGATGATTSIQQARLQFAASATGVEVVSTTKAFSFIVPPGQVYKVVTASATGTPSFTLGSAKELTL